MSAIDSSLETVVASEEVPWMPMPGEQSVEVKFLWRNEAASQAFAQTRFLPGGSMPPHRHEGDELVFVLEGLLGDDRTAETARAGQVSYRPRGCTHRVHSPTGATVLALLNGPRSAVPDDAPPSTGALANVNTDSGLLPWTRHRENAWHKLLWSDPEQGRSMSLIRLESSAALPGRAGRGEQLLYVLEGRAVTAAGPARPGSLVHLPQGSAHTLNTTHGFTAVSYEWDAPRVKPTEPHIP